MDDGWTVTSSRRSWRSTRRHYLRWFPDLTSSGFLPCPLSSTHPLFSPTHPTLPIIPQNHPTQHSLLSKPFTLEISPTHQNSHAIEFFSFCFKNTHLTPNVSHYLQNLLPLKSLTQPPKTPIRRTQRYKIVQATNVVGRKRQKLLLAVQKGLVSSDDTPRRNNPKVGGGGKGLGVGEGV